MYNTNQEFLSCFLFITLLRTDLPHIATMGRDEILQQTHFKALKRNHPKKTLSTLKINHKIPIPTI
ncbi:cag pathogenicity island protein [Helicobacter pylori]|uniref:cag pathogenicity island protein n=1 Tax=Helicobacter pylori TaxID=210 RepID=UPI0012AD096B